MKGKCALITGSTAGLGAATAARLAADGCNIMLNGFGARSEIEVQRRELAEAHGVRVLYHGADMAQPAEIAELMEAAIDAFGSVDILINNAVVRNFAPVHEFPVAVWDRSIAVKRLERISHHSTGAARDACEWLGPHRQHVLDLRIDRRGEPGRLRDQQDRSDRHDARSRARMRAVRRDVQRGMSWFRIDACDRRARAGDHDR
jgi:hypothetical protein